MDQKAKNRLKALLREGVREKIYPGAVLLVAFRGKIVFFQEVGRRSLVLPACPVRKDTIFDLASLTKPLATTLAVMKCVDNGTLTLDQPLENLLPAPLPGDKRHLTPRWILAHCSGFAAWKAFYTELVRHPSKERKKLLRKWVMESPLAYSPGKKSLYSDLGFMILEWVVEECTGSPLHEFINQNFLSPLSLGRMFLDDGNTRHRRPPSHFAATENCSWRKRIIHGTVHDENAYALGGYSGHAGLFGTAADIYTITMLLRDHYLGERQDYLSTETVRTFFMRQNLVKGSTWALGWDTPSPRESSSGMFFSEKSVGHLGYTGVSLWLDLEQDVLVIFLSNRIHPSRRNEKIRAFRPLLHNTIMREGLLHGRN